VLETLSYAVTLAYSVKNTFPFSTYGENLFLTAQNVVISLLVAFMAGRSATKPLAVAALFGASTYVLTGANHDLLAMLQLSTLPLSLASKVPQIVQNARARSTGQLSAFAVFAQLLGSLARLFTTLTEVGDTRMGAGFALAFLLNAVLAYQVFAYGSKPVVKPVPIDIRAEQEGSSVLAEKGTGSIQWGAEAPSSKPELAARTASPGFGSASPSKQWKRKVA
jgi:mannose-P-dolichol utilization defect protein 1